MLITEHMDADKRQIRIKHTIGSRKKFGPQTMLAWRLRRYISRSCQPNKGPFDLISLDAGAERKQTDGTSSDPTHDFFGWNVPCKGLGCCTIDDYQPASQNLATEGVTNCILGLDLLSGKGRTFHRRVDPLYQKSMYP
jgi:hypothetical protein